MVRVSFTLASDVDLDQAEQYHCVLQIILKIQNYSPHPCMFHVKKLHVSEAILTHFANIVSYFQTIVDGY